MVTELQFVAVAAFLIWGLVSSLCGVLAAAAPDAARLVRRDRGIKPEAPTPEDVLHTTPEHDQATAAFVSDHIAVASASPPIEPSLDARAT